MAALMAGGEERSYQILINIYFLFCMCSRQDKYNCTLVKCIALGLKEDYAFT